MDTERKDRILVVDDEPTLCGTLKFNLELEGYEVDTALSAEEALAMDLSQYSLILLDVMMGEISGFQMARIMKNSPALSSIPIIFLTAKDAEEDMVGGLEIGADDYIAKPYSIRNVKARVKTVLRRMHQIQEAKKDADGTLRFEGLIVHTDTKRCTVDGEELSLPKKEFEILSLLLSHPGRIYNREEILQHVWPRDVVVIDRVVDVHITRLRTKIGRYGKLITARSGYGYSFQG